MKLVHPIVMEFFHRSAISNLPHPLREIYLFIESKESHLEEIASTEQQFIHLMIERSPLKEAAEQFSLNISTVKELMDKAQAEIDRAIYERCAQVKWIDCMNKQKNQFRKNDFQRSFIFVC